MQCPKDQVELSGVAHEMDPLHRCDHCEGAFMAGNVLKELHAFSTLQLRKMKSAAEMPGALGASTTLACPVDGKAMALLNYQGVEIDVCPACLGIWLDHGELEKIKTIIGTRPRAQNKARSTRSDALENTADALDGVDVFDGVLDFVGDAVGSLFDGISF